MLNEVLKQINNYFLGDTVHEVDVTFTTTDTLEGNFTDTFQAGQYIYVYNSLLNDGVYKILTITDTTITIDATTDILIDTESVSSVGLIQCVIPKTLLAIIADISLYSTNIQDGISSESQGGRSVSYNGGAQGGSGSSWTSAFSNRLGPYKKVRWR